MRSALQACIHLSTIANTGVLLDRGATSLVALAQQRIDPNTIATVFVCLATGLGRCR
jgi:hypothetical protein